MVTQSTTLNPVDSTTVNYVIANIEGELHAPDDFGHRMFFIAVIQQIQDHIRTDGTQSLIDNPRGHAPAYGAGSAVQLMTTQQMAETVAASHAHTFNGELVAVTASPEDYTPHQLAIRELLVSIEQDIWSVVAYGLEESELRMPTCGYLAGVLTPARD